MPPIQKPLHSRRRTFLKDWRKFKKKTQENVGAALGTDYTTVGRIERGEAPYNQDYLERLADFLECSVTDLLDVNPREDDPSRDILDQLNRSPVHVQERVRMVIETLIKAG